jgi:hypothetical protein
LIKETFIPEYAQIVRSENNVMTLKFNEGFSADFYINASLKDAFVIVEIDHVQFSGEKYQDYKKQINTFISILEKKNIGYLV